ncbi:MAG: carbon-nitrogen hydrolase family protein, partial [Sphingomonadales bacterium]|nr:carbon-nitrogen hydrolase family protein [Sphingomonadales bacterium]
KKAGVWLHAGSLAIQTDGGKIANRSYVISPDGDVVATYDKIHMFDVDLPNGESYRESDSYDAGSEAIVVETPWGGLGLSICYDLRFPDMYRQLAKAGATLLAIPAAFTKLTGEAHWHTLLTARAIENGAFVLAPAQVGRHANGRDTYGHSCVVDPWGRQILDAGTEIGVSLAALDLSEVERARERIPSLLHDRVMEVKRK